LQSLSVSGFKPKCAEASFLALAFRLKPIGSFLFYFLAEAAPQPLIHDPKVGAI